RVLSLMSVRRMALVSFHEWGPLGPPENRRRYPIYSGRTRFPEELKKGFPGEEKAIDEYMKLVKVGSFCITDCDQVV
ncbi:MAG: hypothetical protein ACRC41_04795, partial [Sarcina sp.]